MCFSLGFSPKETMRQELGCGWLIWGMISGSTDMEKWDKKEKKPNKEYFNEQMAAKGNWVSVPLKSLWEIIWNVSQNHHTRWCGNWSTPSLLTKCGPLRTLTSLYCLVAPASGSIQMDQDKNGRNTVTSTTLISSLTSLSLQEVCITYPSSYSWDLPERLLSKCAEWMDKPPQYQHDKINIFNRFLLLYNAES